MPWDEQQWEVAKSVVLRLRNHGYQAYFAGGCVRDQLLGLPAKDIDIATDAPPETVGRLFPRHVAVGIQFGVIRVLFQDGEFEVATFRSDGAYLDGRRPVAVHFASPEEDAQRRDFTINGMFFDPVGNEVVDFVGGRADLSHRILRAIGEPALRFEEDRLRVLRAIRFAARFSLRIEPATWAAVKRFAPRLGQVSPERIRDELVKILGDPNRVTGLDLLDESGILGILLPEVAALKGCEQPAQFHPEGDVYVHTRKVLGLLPATAEPLLALAALLHDIGKVPTRTYDTVDERIRFNGHDRVGAAMTERIMNRLRFSNHDIELVTEAVQNHMIFKDVLQMRPAKLRRFMARSNFPLELELHRADCLGSFGGLDNYEFLRGKRQEFAQEPLIPPPLATGHDLIELGLRPGPQFGMILEAVLSAQLDNEISTREEALALIRRLAGLAAS